MPRTPVRLCRGAASALAVGALAVPVAVAPAVAAPAASVAGAPSPSPSPSDSAVRPLTPEVAGRLDDAVKGVMREAGIPGVTVGVWSGDDSGYVRSFGVADKASGRRMSPGLNLRIGSETKTFTVTALLQLVDQGKARLDDPIGEYVDGVPNGDRITLRQLAGMRSGLFNYSDDPAFVKALTSDPRRSFTPRQLLDYAFRHPVRFPPGREFSYCNTNLILLGLVVEQRSGQRLGDYIHDHITRPAGMDRTLFPSGTRFPQPRAQGYTNQTADGTVQATAGWNPSWAWAAGAMVSDLDDMRVWAKTVATGELPDGKRLVDAATQRQRLVTPPTSVPGAGYGLGIFDVHGWIGHNGSLPGYESLTVYLPSADTTLVVLLNTDIDHAGQEPSTLLGEAITKVVSPGHVFDLPAQPAAR